MASPLGFESCHRASPTRQSIQRDDRSDKWSGLRCSRPPRSSAHHKESAQLVMKSRLPRPSRKGRRGRQCDADILYILSVITRRSAKPVDPPDRAASRGIERPYFPRNEHPQIPQISGPNFPPLEPAKTEDQMRVTTPAEVRVVARGRPGATTRRSGRTVMRSPFGSCSRSNRTTRSKMTPSVYGSGSSRHREATAPQRTHHFPLG